jgi:hypothetical protein
MFLFFSERKCALYFLCCPGWGCELGIFWLLIYFSFHSKAEPQRPTRGRCYDHNFLRFSTISGEKIGVFLKSQCYDQNFA